jgi:hypothetical protein
MALSFLRRKKTVSEPLRLELKRETPTKPGRLQQLSDTGFACVPINRFTLREAVYQCFALYSEQARIETTAPDPLWGDLSKLME